jgi:hypothetical protein
MLPERQNSERLSATARPRAEIGLVPVCAALALGLVAFCVIASMQSSFDPASFGLGLNTTTHTAYFEGHPVSSGAGPDSLFKTYRGMVARDREIVLCLGASQLHAINDYHDGDHLAVYYLNQRAKTRGANTRFLLDSQANGGFQDLLMLYLADRNEGMRPDWVAIAVVYDDLREANFLPAALHRLEPIPEDALAVGGEAVRRVQLSARALEQPEEAKSPVNRNATAGTPQEALENTLLDGLRAALPGYRYAGCVSARISIMVRIFLADLMSGVLKQQRAPAVPALEMKRNHEALLALLALARHDGAKVLLYRQPHRPGEVPFYHDRTAYDAYYKRITALADTTEGVYALDLETIVPAEYYGRTNSGRPDAFHFTDRGHEILAEHLSAFFAQHEEGDRRAVQ